MSSITNQQLEAWKRNNRETFDGWIVVDENTGERVGTYDEFKEDYVKQNDALIAAFEEWEVKYDILYDEAVRWKNMWSELNRQLGRAEFQINELRAELSQEKDLTRILLCDKDELEAEIAALHREKELFVGNFAQGKPVERVLTRYDEHSIAILKKGGLISAWMGFSPEDEKKLEANGIHTVGIAKVLEMVTAGLLRVSQKTFTVGGAPAYMLYEPTAAALKLLEEVK